MVLGKPLETIVTNPDKVQYVDLTNTEKIKSSLQAAKKLVSNIYYEVEYTDTTIKEFPLLEVGDPKQQRFFAEAREKFNFKRMIYIGFSPLDNCHVFRGYPVKETDHRNLSKLPKDKRSLLIYISPLETKIKFKLSNRQQ